MDEKTVLLIPNYNGLKDLKECLNSLKKQTYKDFKIVVIDNNSSDNSVKYLRKNFSSIDVLQLKRNFGFAKSMNLGINYALDKYGPEFIGLVNNDVVLDKNWLLHLIKSLKSNQKIAAVNPNILFYNDKSIINSQGLHCNIFGEAWDINIFKKLGEIKSSEKYVLAPSGAAILIRTKALEDVGTFDERYFAYAEDLDWGWRANLFGYKVVFEKKAKAYHKFGSTLRKNPEIKEYLCKRNYLCNVLKNYEVKTLIKIIPKLFLQYLEYPVWVVSRKDISNNKKPIFMTISLKSAFWNLKNLKHTLYLRRVIQSKRVNDDEYIFKLMIQNGKN